MIRMARLSVATRRRKARGATVAADAAEAIAAEVTLAEAPAAVEIEQIAA